MSLPLAILLAALPAFGSLDRGEGAAGWPLWEAYRATFVSRDGRVIDRTNDNRSTSEGQAYTLFFSLVANDRDTFQRVLTWTRDNLTAGDLGTTLPAWHWGKDEAGEWGMLSPTPASDADLWLAYALLEAGRLWCEPEYAHLGQRVLARIETTQIAEIPDLGTVLMPGPAAYFTREEARRKQLWRLNPSYLPLPLLRRLSALRPDGPWAAISPAGDPEARDLRSLLDGPYAWWKRTGRVPVRVNWSTGAAEEAHGPPGFYGVLLPFALRAGDPEEVARIRIFLATRKRRGLYGDPPAYYDQGLALFAEGYAEARYAFTVDGRLEPRWTSRCE